MDAYPINNTDADKILLRKRLAKAELLIAVTAELTQRATLLTLYPNYGKNANPVINQDSIRLRSYIINLYCSAFRLMV